MICTKYTMPYSIILHTVYTAIAYTVYTNIAYSNVNIANTTLILHNNLY